MQQRTLSTSLSAVWLPVDYAHYSFLETLETALNPHGTSGSLLSGSEELVTLNSHHCAGAQGYL